MYPNSKTQLAFSPSLTALSPETNFAIVGEGCATHSRWLSELGFGRTATVSRVMSTGI